MDAPNTELSFSFARFAEGFDQHIRQSIRGYVDLLSDCIALSEYFVEDGTVIFDVGCRPALFSEKYGARTVIGARTQDISASISKTNFAIIGMSLTTIV